MIKDNIIHNCKSIIDFLVNENDPEVRRLKYDDFKHKFSSLENIHSYNVQMKKQYDVILFVVVRVEFEALNKILSFTTKGKLAKDEYNNIRCWEYSLDRNPKDGYTPDPVKMLIVFLGEAGDINCSIACMRIFSLCDCNLAILSGIAAGYEPEIGKYSVVVSNGVVDYEPQRVEKDGNIIFRPENYDLEASCIRDTAILEMEDERWRIEYKNALGAWNKRIEETAFDTSLIEKAEIKAGIIASGRKLLADSITIQNLRKQLPFKKGIIAAEMEGGGFCPACKEFRTNWVVIRGISDFGGLDKDQQNNKEHQFVAAVAAMSATVHYLTEVYRKPDDPGGDMSVF